MGKEQKLSIWLLGITIILLGTSLYLNISNTVITNESIVLTFVGILATFIVVGNYAQVTEIRNNTNSQIKDLETRIQNKISEFEILHLKIAEAVEKLSEVERKTNFNSAEAFRLYGNITKEKGSFKLSTAHYIDAAYFYNISGNNTKKIEGILNIMLRNLEQGKWHKPGQKHDFKYDNKIERINELSNTYEQKQKIIDLLVKYREEKPTN